MTKDKDVQNEKWDEFSEGGCHWYEDSHRGTVMPSGGKKDAPLRQVSEELQGWMAVKGTWCCRPCAYYIQGDLYSWA